MLIGGRKYILPTLLIQGYINGLKPGLDSLSYVKSNTNKPIKHSYGLISLAIQNGS